MTDCLVTQWLRLPASKAGRWGGVGEVGSIPGQGTRAYMPQLRSKIPCAIMDTQCSRINYFILFF